MNTVSASRSHPWAGVVSVAKSAVLASLITLVLAAWSRPLQGEPASDLPGPPSSRVLSPQGAGLLPAPSGMASSSMTLTVHAEVEGTTTTYIGATEAAGFWIEDLTDLGINSYRLWTKMAELEWWDDDDSVDGLWDDSEYGTPTIAEIKADSVSGFTNTVPWAWWDERFNEIQSWRYGEQSRRGIIEALVQNEIVPVVTLRTIDNEDNPDYWPAVQWAPKPPVDTDFLNEWWEHCFAVAYWLNVRHDYGVTHFEVLNEPDYPGQGWNDDGGTTAEYVQLVLAAHDAVVYANGFVGLPAHIHAPVVAAYNSPYVSYTLDNADDAVQVVDYHTYATDVGPSISTIKNVIDNHDTDGIRDPVWNSEWGALWTSYDSLDRAIVTANQLLTFSEEQVEGVTVFNMYDWSTTPGQDYGLVDLQDDGEGGAIRVPTETYYAYRLMTRALIGGKDRLEATLGGAISGTRAMVTRDDTNLFIVLLRDDAGASSQIMVDLSEVGVGDGLATVYEYSATHKDSIVVSPTVANGTVVFSVPTDGISLLVVPQSDLSSSTKAVSPPNVQPGDLLTYTFTLSNTSSVGPAHAWLTDTVPTHTMLAGGPWASGGSTGQDSQVITWAGPVLPEYPVTVSYRVSVTRPLSDGTTITNSALLDDGMGQMTELGPVAVEVLWDYIRFYFPTMSK